MQKVQWLKNLCVFSSTFLLAALSPSTHAVIQSFTTDAFCGWYTGIGVGGQFSSATERVNDTVNIKFDRHTSPHSHLHMHFPIGEDDKHANRKNNFLGEVFLGYGAGFKDWYIGLEAFVKGTTYNVKTTANPKFIVDFEDGFGATPTFRNAYKLDTQTHTKVNPFEFGIDLRPGIFLSCTTLAYGRLGLAFNRVAVKVETITNINLDLPTSDVLVRSRTINERYQASKNNAAFRIGAGIEHRFYCEDLTFRLDYAFTYYGKVSVFGGTKEEIGTAGFIGRRTPVIYDSDISRKVKVSSSTIIFGLAYYWK